MLAGRELSIRMRKADTAADKDEIRSDSKILEDRIALVHTVIQDTVKTVFAGIFTYVVLDTFRQVLVARNTNPKY